MVREGYKQTEIGMIPKSWEVCPLQNLTEKADPITYGVLKPGDYVYGGIPLLQIKDVIHGAIKVEELHRIGEQLDSQYSRTRLSGGEIVVSLVGTIGRIAYIPASLLGANLHRNLAKISISKGHESRFIFYQLESERVQSAIKLTTFGSTQSLLNLSDLRSLLMVVPPPPEQRSIAQALSDVDALIAALDKAIAKKRAIKTATMQQLLTGKKRLPGFGEEKGYKQTEVGVIPEDWSVLPLGELTSFVGSGKSTVERGSGDYPLYGSTGVIGYSQKFEYEGDSILVARVGANAGKLNFVCGSYGVSDNTIIIKLKNDSDIHFFLYQLWNKDLNSLVFGSGQPLITGTQIKNLSVVCPPVAEQRAIATVLSDMDAAIAALETRLAKTHALKQGMMQQLLTGRVRLV